MHEPSAKLHCPNPTCQAVNSEGEAFCHTCRTALPKRYLWAIALSPSQGDTVSLDEEATDSQFGQYWGDRYWVKGDRIVLDTHPGNFPDLPDRVPKALEPYLRLFPYRWHLPQVYGQAGPPSQLKGRNVWLLENAPIWQADGETWTLRPSLDESWDEASPLRQLNWLWQIAQLWEPFSREGVTASLLDLDRLRVEGGLVRLSDLALGRSQPILVQLGRLWKRWIDRTASPYREFLEVLCQSLENGRIATAEQLVTVLDRALDLTSQNYTYRTEIATLSDRGPSRVRNEDACYPVSGQMPTASRSQGADSLTRQLAIVCDGVGGHEGGDIASNLAVHTIEQHLRHLTTPKHYPSRRTDRNGQSSLSLTPTLENGKGHSGNPGQETDGHQWRNRLVSAIEHAIFEANSAISDRNNLEQRQGRQRMGTTLVMSVACDRDLFVTHIGDSRAYLVTRYGCYSITLDDDVATREVRLGYAFYREALQQTSAGSLVQALGMGPSIDLHPTITRLVIDDDCLCLLCSDGLSDYDRVEQIWKQDIQPLLQNGNLRQGAKRLVTVANTANGHDNVTVALTRVRVQPNPQATLSAAELLRCFDNLPEEADSSDETMQLSQLDEDSTASTEFISPLTTVSWRTRLRTGIVMALLLAIVGAILYHMAQLDFDRFRREDSTAAPTRTPTPEPTLFPEPGERPIPQVGTKLRLNGDLPLRSRPINEGDALSANLTAGRVVEIRQNTRPNPAQTWLEVRSCREIAEGEAIAPSPRDFVSGWVEWSQLKAAQFETLDETVTVQCQPLSPPTKTPKTTDSTDSIE
ncbi:PP2C family protein-serine/threonine phosphatase [Baaleninema sp.]|uniref:PP2C family protein-serine/threonine phosphatase n=1 Tax=Baaleninema sp. TaxID=3101197 RepID=UPI003D086E97